MKLKDLAEKVGQLPETFNPMSPMWDLAVDYPKDVEGQIERLRGIIFAQAVYIKKLASAYNTIRDILLEVEVQ